jgi:hypothetical protein
MSDYKPGWIFTTFGGKEGSASFLKKEAKNF